MSDKLIIAIRTVDQHPDQIGTKQYICPICKRKDLQIVLIKDEPLCLNCGTVLKWDKV